MKSKRVEIYHPSDDNWTYTNDLNEKRYSSCGCSLGAKVYVFGGDTTAALTSVETFEASEHLNGNASIQWQLLQFKDQGHIFGEAH